LTTPDIFAQHNAKFNTIHKNLRHLMILDIIYGSYLKSIQSIEHHARVENG